MTHPLVALMDHGMGNLRSVAKALEAAGAAVRLVDTPESIERHDALCVPGQGIFGRCATTLDQRGLADAVRDWVGSARPYLGICLGMQVLFETSEEPDDPSMPGDRATRPGLGIIEGAVVKLDRRAATIPHIGWNLVSWRGRDTYFYFDHSYVAVPADPALATGTCRHGSQFAAVVESGSILAVQFHPEKSSSAGISLLQDWVARL